MNYQEWKRRQEEGEPATLPSGLDIRFRRVSVFDLAAQGEIPVALQAQVDAVISGKVQQLNTLRDFLQFGQLIDMVIDAAIVSPAELRAAELPYTDKLALFNELNNAAVRLRSFRGEAGESVDAAPTGEDVRPAAVGVLRAGT